MFYVLKQLTLIKLTPPPSWLTILIMNTIKVTFTIDAGAGANTLAITYLFEVKITKCYNPA